MTMLAFELAATIRHDGQGGVTDLLETDAGLASWIELGGPRLPTCSGGPSNPLR
jgi:hypothetical protein